MWLGNAVLAQTIDGLGLFEYLTEHNVKPAVSSEEVEN